MAKVEMEIAELALKWIRNVHTFALRESQLQLVLMCFAREICNYKD